MDKALKAADDGLSRLYDAIEKGVVTLDSTLQDRVNRLKDERERILGQTAQARQEAPSPRRLSPGQVEFACERMREMLLDPESGYGRQLLRTLVTEIRVKPGLVEMSGSTAALENAVSETKPGTSIEVPRLIPYWRRRAHSNRAKQSGSSKARQPQ